MKGLIPAAGLGRRMFPLTLTRPKTLLSILGKPILHYVLQVFNRIGIKEIGIIVNATHRKSIESYVSSHYEHMINFIEQNKALGLANAILTARDFINNESCLIINGDAILEGNWQDLINSHHRMSAKTTLGLCKIPRPERFGVVQLKGNRVIKVIEKPEIPFSPLASASTYLIEPIVLNFIERIQTGKRGEYDFADAIQLLIRENESVIGYELDNWIDLGRPWDYLDANLYFLQRVSQDVDDSVMIGTGTEIQNSFIDRACEIAENCRILHSSVDKNVTIGRSSVIERSVVLASTTIGENVIIKNSVIGENCIIGNSVRFLDKKNDNQEIHTSFEGKLVNTHRTCLGSILADNVTINENQVIPPGSIFG
ncbi:sugar phosphate nucleotidyltransferase [Candidatus Borrarchaeum sp.]|uniref:sugar phosphate nucleotidyltransferase n=1 Tax=Candidatus Borrarchaeum sp. TaxID=2846742 RepID=UPI00257B5147|nr:sugar phosphate nucleotidyltransferase [Candidatus Borrarchaeum sp.]